MSFLFRLQKNIFWLTLSAVLFLGYSLAYVSSTVAAIFLEEPTVVPSSRPKPRLSTAASRPDFSQFESIVSGNLFQSRSADIGAGGVPADVKDVILHGVLAGSKEFSRAIIQVKGENEISEYGIDSVAGGNRVMAIYGNSVLLERGNQQLELAVGQDSSELPPPEAQSQVIGPATPGAKRITVQRSKITSLTKDPTAISKMKMAPVTVAGKIAGLKMAFVPPDSVFYELGARSGDIIRRLNGQKLETNDRLIEFYQGLNTMNQIQVEVERGGKILPFEIVIQN
ncbi:MAG: hypothetical protein H3C43_11760 [Leptonema sp. (in: Bacteria)]|nr:hypothetical protein [Leptonema sp. (in: bacteria)]